MVLQGSELHYRAMRMAINADVTALEKFAAHLEESLSSLGEVLLQSRRSLDLLFLQRGVGEGAYKVLGEQCCFYTNHSGVSKDSKALLRMRLQDRQ